MRIAVVGPDYDDSSARIIVDECLGIGMEAAAFDPRFDARAKTGSRRAQLGGLASSTLRQASISGAVRLLNRSLRIGLAELDPDLIIFLTTDLAKNEVRALSEAVSAPAVLWYPDSVVNLNGQRVFEAGFDAIFLKDRLVVDRIRDRVGEDRVFFLPQGCRSTNPEFGPDQAWSRDYASLSESIVVAGGMYPTRVTLLEHLLPHASFMLFGPVRSGLPAEIRKHHTNRFLTGGEKAYVFRHARAVLNNVHYGEFGGTNLRMFEAAAAGARILTDDLPQVSEYFEPESEVVTYQSVSHLVELVKSDLAADYPDMGDAAQRRALSDHTIGRRIHDMLAMLGISH